MVIGIKDIASNMGSVFVQMFQKQRHIIDSPRIKEIWIDNGITDNAWNAARESFAMCPKG
jgi:hypothetical protein